MRELRTKLSEGGKIAIPVEYQQALGLQVGDEVILPLTGAEVRIYTPRQAIKCAQELVQRYIPQGRSLADELIAERRLESEDSP
jgi:bifunctional DNA-binding transcriptional regulator/antitoxin component of YhaV-PrlF toxin-antitoxin module